MGLPGMDCPVWASVDAGVGWPGVDSAQRGHPWELVLDGQSWVLSIVGIPGELVWGVQCWALSTVGILGCWSAVARAGLCPSWGAGVGW